MGQKQSKKGAASRPHSSPARLDKKGGAKHQATPSSSKDEMAPPTPPSAIGIHASVFFSLHRKYPGAVTSQKLCNKFIKPATKKRRCAYVDILQEQSPDALGPATCFISHAWRRPFADIVDAVEQFERKHPGTFYWFDLFTNNQHEAVSFPFEWWTTTFRESISSIGRVMLVMSPWNNPVPLTRAWCLFEMYSTIVGEAEMNVVIPSGEIASFKEAMSDDYDTIMNTLLSLDAQKAEASNPKDRDQIFNVVSQKIPGGFATLNNKVKGHLRESYLHRCVEIAEDAEDGDLLLNIGAALHTFGDHDKALELLERCLEIYRHAGKENHPNAASTYNNMGLVYDSKSDYDKALEYYGKSLAIMLATLGENHPTTAKTYNNMGSVFYSKRDYEKALEYYGKSLAIYLATLGENHPSIADTYMNLGSTYNSKAECDKALEYYGKSLAIKLATLGENHPDTGMTYMNMGNVYNIKGDYDKALEYLGKSLAIKLATVGENHPSTADTYNNMGSTYDSKGDYDKALEYYGKSLAITLATLGENHPSTADTYSSMGIVYNSKGDYDKALEYYGKSLAIKLATLGENHPDTAANYNNMGLVYDSKGDKDKALEYYGKSLAIYLATLGGVFDVQRKKILKERKCSCEENNYRSKMAF